MWVYALNRNLALTVLAWGIFFFMIGLSLAVTAYGMALEVVLPYVAVGTGVILIGLNSVRAFLGITPSRFSLFIGILVFVLGIGLVATGSLLPWYAIVVMLVGLFVIAEAARSLVKSK